MKLKRVMSLLAAVAATTSLLSSCTNTPAATGKISVTVAAYPLQFLTERIVGNAGTVTNLTTPGTEPHDLELTAKQIAEMSGTDAVVYIGGFQAAVDAAIKSTPPKVAIDVSQGVNRLAGAGEEAGSYDPHIWLSPTDMVKMAETINTQLSSEKPELASTFKTNTDSLVADLTNLDSSFKTGLSRCTRTQFITSHAAFAYLAGDYDLTQIAIAGLDPTEEPTAARIVEVQKLAKTYGVTTIFFETLVSDVVAKRIAGDLGLKTAVLDPIEGITEASAGTNYLEVMQSNLKALQEANGCS